MSLANQMFISFVSLSCRKIRSLNASIYCQILLVFSLVIPSISWAVQMGIVMPEKAFIYADIERTSPIGFVRRGKKLKLSSIAKNKGSVYATVVSGKVAYISVTDVNTQVEDLESERLVAERFQKAATKKLTSSYSAGVFSYSSILTQANSSGPTKNNESVNWIGVGIKGELVAAPRFDIQVLLQAMQAKNAELETWRVFSAGVGAAYRLIDFSNFRIRMIGELQAVPFSTYELIDAFRIRGYGGSVAGGMDVNLKFTQNWGLEVLALYQYVKLTGFKPPKTQVYDSPSYMGVRLGANLTYMFN